MLENLNRWGYVGRGISNERLIYTGREINLENRVNRDGVINGNKENLENLI